ncbi:hypothetical protein Bca4012_101261 [Brassica carinata]|uniref:Uncharacterized protein n=3 Tax=Brassica TaxID=3705 RepID=A0A0D3CYU0_BRAOL|nr:PREDICTED: uncharacterized protein LOC106300285 [Brassica oleracea var. oleracea]XP_013702233.1 uncharacterized protein BNAC06G29090D [Brassica napus]KAG2253548.1 hypothetical protein Bca52824_083684 [Brassica carinata]VDD63768.1 unnamed protein product [Brassica oleracea]
MENKTDHGNEDGPKHSQVVKIKKEFEKIRQPSLQQPEMRRVLAEIKRRQRSRSPLGLGERSIPVGN